MAWSPVFGSVITAAVALIGVMYGANLTEHRESHGWAREQRLRAYADLLHAIEKCYGAFTVIAAAGKLHKFQPKAMLSDERLKADMEEWSRWDAEIDRRLPVVELVASDHLWPYLTAFRLGIRSRHRMLLMQLSHAREVEAEEWKSVSGMTHDDIMRARYELRRDISHRAETPAVAAPSPVRKIKEWASLRRRKPSPRTR